MTHPPLTLSQFYDPSSTELEIGNTYHLAGIRDADFDVLSYQDQPGIITFRVSLRVGMGKHASQAMLEIHCLNKESEPRLAHDYWCHQMIIAKNVTYSGKRTSFGLTVENFRIDAHSVSDRFIWLSSPRRDFWMEPLNFGPTLYTSRIDRSEGSVFGAAISKSDQEILFLEKIGPWKLSNFKDEAIEMTADLTRLPKKLVFIDGLLCHPALAFRNRMQL